MEEGDAPTALMHQLHRVTPHLNDDQRKQLLPENLHSLHDNVAQNIKERDLKDTGATRDMNEDMSAPVDTSDSVGKNIQRRLEKDTDMNNRRPVNYTESTELPGENQTRENGVANTGEEFSPERDLERSKLRNQGPEKEYFDRLQKQKDDELASKIKDSQYAHASLKANELRVITADLSQDEFELSVDALLDLGYSEDAIMAEAERRFSK